MNVGGPVSLQEQDSLGSVDQWPRRGDPDDGPVGVQGRPDRTPWWPIVVLASGFVLLCLLQAPGRLAADTKIDVALNPTRFLAGGTHLWSSDSDFGLLPNQRIGYLFPMGSFFLTGNALGLPPWVIQRLWMALLLGVASWGVIRLADALHVGSRPGRVVAGLVYSTSPFVLGKIGSNSIALTASAMLPWIVLPLVLATAPRAGGTSGLLAPRRAAALSGLAVFTTGGVNASVTLDVLLCPAVLLVFAGAGRRTWALRGWWVVSVVFATAWWILALLIQSRYGLNFLPFTETAAITTTTTSVSEALRGASDWMAYLRLPSPWLPAAEQYVATPVAVVGSAVVAALGVWGLARTDLPARRFLVVTFGIGILAVCAAYPGQPGSPLAGVIRDLLGSPFGFLRNVYKFQPVVRLPMALGVAHTLAVAGSRRRRVAPGTGTGWVPGPPPWGRSVRGQVPVALAVAAAVIAGMTPALAGKMTPAGAFGKVPDYWRQAAGWLEANPAGGRTLLLPGTAFGEYDWGRPLDEPMQWLARTPWGVRSLVPLGGVGVARWMDGIEQQLALGSAPGLADALTRAGVGQVLIRNDLQNKDWDVPPSTEQIYRALRGSGLGRTVAFGPMVAARSAAKDRLVPALRNPKEQVPALEVWVVPDGARQVRAYPADTAMVVSGGAEATVQMAAAGMLPDQAVVLAGDLAGPDDPAAADVIGPRTTLVVTDTFARRDNSFGLVHGDRSYVLGPTEGAAGATGPPAQWTDRPVAGHQTTAGYVGGMAVTASSYGFELAPAPDLQPANAVDGDPDTAWQDARTDRGSTGQWLQVDVGHEIEVPSLTVRLLEESRLRPAVHALRVTTETGSVVTPVEPVESPQRLTVPPGPTRFFRVGFEHLSGEDNPFLGAGIRELTVPGVTFQRYLQTPSDLTPLFAAAGSGPVVYMFARNRVDPSLPFGDDEERQLDRRFDVPRPVVLIVRGTAVRLPGALTVGGLPVSSPATGDDQDTTSTSTSARTLSLPCGSGPFVRVDGRRYATQLDGVEEDARALSPITMSVCDDNGQITLGSGPHLLMTEPGSAPFAVDSLTLTDAAAQAEPAAPRATRITGWTPERRTVEIAAGERGFLAVRENANASWTASLNGKPLRVIRLDGWQQGWIIPAGAAGTIMIENRPGQAYRRNIALGATMVAGLVALTVVPPGVWNRYRWGRARGLRMRGLRMRERWAQRRVRGRGQRVRGWWVSGLRGRSGRGAVRLRWAAVTSGMCVVALVAGPVALVVPVFAVLAARSPVVLSWIAAGCVSIAGMVVAFTPDSLPGSGRGAFGWQVQLCGAVAFACVLASTAVRSAPRPVDPR